jgi:hypothetical protein
VSDPQGKVHALSVDAGEPGSPRAPALEFGAVRLPGVYRVEAAGRTTAFAAAVPRAESDLSRIAETELLEKLPKGVVRIETREPGEHADPGAAASPPPGQALDLSFYALAALLFTLAAESLVGTQRR